MGNRIRQYISHFKFNKGQENVGQSWMEHLVADVHVLLMAIVSAVNLGFSRPRRAIPLYRLGRQSRVVRILPGLPFLLAAIALFFFIIIPGDLSKRDRFVTCTVTACCRLPQSNQDSQARTTDGFRLSNMTPTLTSPLTPSDFLSRSLSLLFFFLLLECCSSRSSRL